MINYNNYVYLSYVLLVNIIAALIPLDEREGTRKRSAASLDMVDNGPSIPGFWWFPLPRF